MATIHSFEIHNYRGIREFKANLNLGLQCIIGRGDSGKTSILDAISSLLSNSYSLQFSDSDFYNGDTNSDILMQAVLFDLPDDIIRKYADCLIGIDKDGNVSDDLSTEKSISYTTAILISLVVSKDLEPHWYLSARDNNQIISASDRALFGASFINEYTDNHFTFSRGGYLYRCAKEEAEINNDNQEILDIVRSAKNNMNDCFKGYFTQTINGVQLSAQELGLDDIEMYPYVDSKDIMVGDNNITLSKDGIPLRRLGKGSRKLLSIAVQLANKKIGSIVLIDELELGLEPDRIIHLIHALRNKSNTQIIITTHSRTVLEELSYNEILLLRLNQSNFIHFTEDDQCILRSSASAFFARRIIVCEGRTEFGFIRAMEYYRVKKNKGSMASYGVVAIDGGGTEMIKKSQRLHSYGYDVLVFCDNDVADINTKKQMLRDIGIFIIDCQDSYSFENQIIQDSSWNVVSSFIKSRNEEQPDFDRQTFNEINKNEAYHANWFEKEKYDLREKIIEQAKLKKWFKTIGLGEYIGRIYFENISSQNPETIFYKNIVSLNNWIENGNR